jgi:anti-anti-sigma factor
MKRLRLLEAGAKPSSALGGLAHGFGKAGLRHGHASCHAPLYLAVVEQIAKGDLTARPSGEYSGALGQLGDGLVGMVESLERSLMAERHAQEEARRLQDEIIRVQEATLAQLSTPLIPINDRVVAMPLIGAMDTRRAQRVLETLLNGVMERRAQVAILDVTGVPYMDTQVADGLIRAARAVRLLGVQAVLTGIRPEVARTLVTLGIDLSGIITCGSLQGGIEYAMARLDLVRSMAT